LQAHLEIDSLGIFSVRMGSEVFRQSGIQGSGLGKENPGRTIDQLIEIILIPKGEKPSVITIWDKRVT
jgi:hypothetical protein